MQGTCEVENQLGPSLAVIWLPDNRKAMNPRGFMALIRANPGDGPVWDQQGNGFLLLLGRGSPYWTLPNDLSTAPAGAGRPARRQP